MSYFFRHFFASEFQTLETSELPAFFTSHLLEAAISDLIFLRIMRGLIKSREKLDLPTQLQGRFSEILYAQIWYALFIKLSLNLFGIALILINILLF